MKDKRNVYYLNTAVKNGHDLTNEELVKHAVDHVNEMTSVCEVGFQFGHTIVAISNMLPHVTCSGVEFNPMYVSYGRNHTSVDEINTRIVGGLDMWEPYSDEVDVVVLDNWVNELSDDDQAIILERCRKMARFEVWMPLDIRIHIDCEYEVCDNALIVTPIESEDVKPELEELLSGEKEFKAIPVFPSKPLDSEDEDA